MTHRRVADFFRRAKTERKIHITSFDPCCHRLEDLREIVLCAAEAGTDGFFLGGSTGVDRAMVDAFTQTIVESLNDTYGEEERPPLILFPSSADTSMAAMADAVLFMSLLNSYDVKYLIREQMRAAPFLPRLGLQPVGCGMILIEPGGTAGQVGKADLIKNDDILTALGYATAADAYGFQTIYLNAGSGSPEPVSAEMIRTVAEAIHAPLIVGGGLTNVDKVRVAVEAGADIVVTGTAIEDCDDIGAKVAGLADAVHTVAPSGAK